jgi:hypothetical protein
MPFSVTCPSCRSVLQLPDAVKGKRVKVRCLKCGKSSMVGQADAPATTPRPTPAATLPRPRRGSTAKKVLVVILLVAALGGGGAAGWFLRGHFEKPSPQPIAQADRPGGSSTPIARSPEPERSTTRRVVPDTRPAQPVTPDTLPDKQTTAKKTPPVKEPPATLAVWPTARRWPTLLSRGGQLDFTDAALRAAFAKGNPMTLPEAKRKLPDATAPAFDWTTYVPKPVIHHMKDPNCWAFGVMGAFEWNWALRNGGPMPEFAIQPIFDISQEGGTDAGATVATAMKPLLDHGTCLAGDYPFVGKPGKLRSDVPLPYRLIAWGEVAPVPAIPKPAQIKQALLDHGPLVASVFTTKAFTQYKAGEIFKEHFTRPKGARQANHDVVIVGWDDSKGKGCWKVQNEWSSRWGEGGFMWIEYGCNYVGLETFWVCAQAVQYDLPTNANRMLPGKTDPFHNWPMARAFTLPPEPTPPTVTAAEALKRPGERLLVQFQPRAYGPVMPQGHVMLLSEPDPNAPGCLAVWLLKAGLDRFPAQDPQGLWKYYGGKQLRVHGWVTPYPLGDRVIQLIEVARPDQIEIVK